MRTLCFLLPVFLFASSLHAYTIVLKNGRRCSGDLISDSGSTYQLHDSATGVFLSFKKEQVDAVATTAANTPPKSPQPAAAGASERVTRGVADLAERLREQRTGRARVYTTSDLARTPEVSISGSQTPLQDVAAVSSASLNESEWRNEARKFRKELESAEDRATAAQSACDKAQANGKAAVVAPHDKPVQLQSLMRPPQECTRASELNDRAADARERLLQFQERARRAGVPWSWLE